MPAGSTRLGSHEDYPTGIRWALWQGDDTDTIAAMAGGLLEARLGRQAIPMKPLLRLDHGENFVEYVAQLAERLAATVA